MHTNFFQPYLQGRLLGGELDFLFVFLVFVHLLNVIHWHFLCLAYESLSPPLITFSCSCLFLLLRPSFLVRLHRALRGTLVRWALKRLDFSFSFSNAPALLPIQIYWSGFYWSGYRDDTVTDVRQMYIGKCPLVSCAMGQE